MYRILLVEDDPGIAQAVCAHLRQWELDARCVQNFRAVSSQPLFRMVQQPRLRRAAIWRSRDSRNDAAHRKKARTILPDLPWLNWQVWRHFMGGFLTRTAFAGKVEI